MMRFACLALGLSVVAACGDDGGKASADAAKQIDAAPHVDSPTVFDMAPDSPPAPADQSCETTDIPTTTTAANITLSGTITVQSLAGGDDITGAVLTVKTFADTTITADGNPKTIAAGDEPGAPTDKTTANFSFTVATGGDAVDGHVLAVKDGLRNTLIYPAHPLVADQANAPIIMSSQQTFGQLENLGSASEADGQGSLVVVVVDCAQNPVAGATVTVTQGGADVGTIRYSRPLSFGGFNIPLAPSTSATDTDSTGTVFVFGTPAGTNGAGLETTIIAKQGAAGMPFRAHVVKSFAQSLSTTVVAP